MSRARKLTVVSFKLALLLQEEEWKSRHRESLRKERSQEQQQEDGRAGDNGDQQELWARLEELEVREALEKEWEDEEKEGEQEQEQSSDSDREEEERHQAILQIQIFQ